MDHAQLALERQRGRCVFVLDHIRFLNSTDTV